MISEGRMSGSMDQVENVIYFEKVNGTLETWDTQIESVCRNIGLITDKIIKDYPKFEIN
jgi:hypothetical protein